MSKKKHYGVAVLMALSMGIVSQPAGIYAATITGTQNSSTEITDPDNETPAFASPEEAVNAANLAEVVALENDSLKTALDDLESAHDALLAAVQSRDRNAISVARRALNNAEETFMRELSGVSGVAESDIFSMHDTGMAWGKIGHELGINPEMLGIGHDIDDKVRNRDMKQDMDHMSGVGVLELSEATERNMESGWSSGHGSSIQAGVHEPGTWQNNSGMISGAGGLMSSVGRNNNHDSMSGNDHGNEMAGGSMESESGWGGSGSNSSGNQDHNSGMGSDNDDHGSDMGGNDHGGSAGGHGGESEGSGSGGHEGGSGDHGGKW